MRPTRIWIAALGSLVPWSALLVAVAVAEDGPVLDGGIAAAAALYLAFVAFPSMLALLAARSPVTQVAVLAVLTAVAAWAGRSMATSDDAQAGLAVLLVPMVAIPLALVVSVGETVPARRRAGSGPRRPAGVADRLAALVVDIGLVAGVAAVPVLVLSDAGQEVVAGLVAAALGTAYLGAATARGGRTAGYALLGLRVVDRHTGGAVPLGRALLRGLVISLEVMAAPTVVLAVPAVLELLSVVGSGQSLTDRLLATEVVTERAS